MGKNKICKHPVYADVLFNVSRDCVCVFVLGQPKKNTRSKRPLDAVLKMAITKKEGRGEGYKDVWNGGAKLEEI